MAKCIECQNFSLKKAGREIAAISFGVCVKSTESGLFLSATIERDCEKFQKESENTINLRRKYLAKNGGVV